MHRCVFVAGLTVVALLIPAVLATGQTTQPSLSRPTMQPSLSRQPTTQPSAAAQQDLAEAVEDTKTWARWGCILAGLALLGVLWIGYSMQTLAKNQVQLGRMIQAGGQK